MSEAAFFYNTTVQKPDRSKPPSAHTNISIHSQAQPVRLFSKGRSRSQSKSNSQRNEVSSQLDSDHPVPPLNLHQIHSSPPTLAGTPISRSDNHKNNDPFSEALINTNTAASSTSTSTTTSVGIVGVGMLSTPLLDYKHSANQSNKARAASEAKAKRKSSSTSGHSSHSIKNASGVERYASTNSAVHQQRGASDSVGRSSSISSTTGSSSISKINSLERDRDRDRDPFGSSSPEALMAQPFTKRNGRRYLRDPTLAYPLPCDLPEIHRQTLRTMLLCQVFNGPTCSSAFNNRPPKRVLEIACGTGFWSVMCHKHFSHKGHSSIQFTGIDIAPLAPRMDADDDMNWRFVQHDLRKTPLPFRDEEFSLIMVKDLSMAQSTKDNPQSLMDEYLRILKPGGTLEIWDGDHTIRMLLSHTPPAAKDKDNSAQALKQIHTNAMGAYTITPQTPLAEPQNQYLIDYNTWIAKALDARDLPTMPCTSMRAVLLQEAAVLEKIESRRLAIPLGEVRWEREGVGGSTTSLNGLHESKGKSKELDRKHLTPGQAALRRTALMSIIQMIESLEPLLKEASGKSMDEWDRWCGNLMTDLLKNNGTSWGECLEVGAWWAKKKDPKSDSNA
ncbi:hypothetical protein BCIN_08g00520 [Botrytis cinerea B05.10]|uniref:Methyltransferase domain-containing protein n=1 Tax=Botryotinia fuckeliana (strain B05.10) TaxID=332648 RepID=A0A384JNW1_BOTFB|nr:hypothetical protein BCIN_08g00520 [Botrytis cinerea B05.10]ATZ52295.1 hypothetical protein BCIN_08g00520 [Botrytis cinerea B05.10]